MSNYYSKIEDKREYAMKNKKDKIEKHRYVTFLNDEDGVSAKDYLLLISTTVFFGFIAVGLIMILFGIEIPQNYLDLLNMVDSPLMVIIGGIFSTQVADSIIDSRNPKNQQEDNYSEEDKYE